MEYNKYTDSKGRIIWVGQGMGLESSTWFTLYSKPGRNSSHRLVSPDLPLRSTMEQAQADLDAYAAKKGFGINNPAQVKPAPPPEPPPVKQAPNPEPPNPRPVWTPPPKIFKDLEPWDNVKSLATAKTKKSSKPKLEQISLF